MAAQGEVEPPTWRVPHRARLRSRRCRACYAFILGDARCERCVEVSVSTTTAAQAAEADVLGNGAAKDQHKRLNHRHNHSRASQILVDDRKVRNMRLPGSSVVAHAEADQRAGVSRDVAALADAAIGAGHAKSYKVIDHLMDSYFNISYQGVAQEAHTAESLGYTYH